MDTGGGNVFVTKSALLRMGVTPQFIQVAEGDSLWDGGGSRFKEGFDSSGARHAESDLFGFGDKMFASLGGSGMVGQTGLPAGCGCSTIRDIRSLTSRRPQRHGRFVRTPFR